MFGLYNNKQTNIISFKKNSTIKQTKNGEIVLLFTTNCWNAVKCVSQKQDKVNDKSQWYNVLVTFIFEFSWSLY